MLSVLLVTSSLNLYVTAATANAPARIATVRAISKKNKQKDFLFLETISSPPHILTPCTSSSRDLEEDDPFICSCVCFKQKYLAFGKMLILKGFVYNGFTAFNDMYVRGLLFSVTNETHSIYSSGS